MSGKYIKLILDEVSNYGSATYKRLYGDFQTPSVRAWMKNLRDYAITPVFQYNYTHDNQGGFWLDCMGINRNRECGKTILRYNISIDDKRCLIQDDYGLPVHLYGNLFINSEEGPLICCHKEGESHIFRNNIFHFADKPANGWQKSSFHNNWYSGNTGFPESDREASGDIPFCLSGLLDNKPVSREECESYWNLLAALGDE